ncbi:MAG: T9SS type A sorting domain-containing protein [Chitinophagales bacterium]|nr:T9SS type A sorting domain-containing protein [Chitinophagales bacterium]
MKAILFFYGVFCFISFTSTAQVNPAIKWQNTLGSPGSDIAHSIQQTRDGGFIVAGNASHNGGGVMGAHGLDDYWIVKLNKNGKAEWGKCYGGTSYDVPWCVRQTPDNGFIVAGFSSSMDGDVTGHHPVIYEESEDIWILKIDSAGNIQWEKCYGGSRTDAPHSIEITNDGGYIVVGYTSSTDGDVTNYHGGPYDAWVFKIDSYGKILWQRTYGGSASEYPNSIIPLSNGEYIFGCVSYSKDGDVTGHHGSTLFGDAWAVDIDGEGNIIWEKSYGGSGSEGISSIIQSNDGNFVFVGTGSSTDGDVTGNHGASDYWAVKINDVGQLLNENSFGGSETDGPSSIKPTYDGGFVIAGQSESHDGQVTGNHSDPGYFDYWIVKLDSNLSLSGEISMGGSLDEVANDIVVTQTNKYIVAGFAESDNGDVIGLHNASGNNYEDYWIVCLRKNVFETNAVAYRELNEYEEIQVPLTLSPNLTTGTFQITLKAPGNADQLVDIELLNTAGQLVLRRQSAMVDGTLRTEIQLNASLPEGIYFVKARINNREFPGKVLLTRKQ